MQLASDAIGQMPSECLSVLVELFLSTFDNHTRVSSLNWDDTNTTFLRNTCVPVCCRWVGLCGILGPLNSIACGGGVLEAGVWSNRPTMMQWSATGNWGAQHWQRCVCVCVTGFHHLNLIASSHLYYLISFFHFSKDRRSDMYGQHMAHIRLLIYLRYCV